MIRQARAFMLIPMKYRLLSFTQIYAPLPTGPRGRQSKSASGYRRYLGGHLEAGTGALCQRSSAAGTTTGLASSTRGSSTIRGLVYSTQGATIQLPVTDLRSACLDFVNDVARTSPSH